MFINFSYFTSFKRFCGGGTFCCFNSTIHYNNVIIVFFEDKNLVQLSEFSIIRTAFVTNSNNHHSTVLYYATTSTLAVH
jgi:hypothetical protein